MVTTNRAKIKKKEKPKKVNKLRYAEYYDMQETFDDLYAKAKEGGTFDKLTDLIFSRDNILLSYRNIKRNDGSVTPGTDGLTIQSVAKFGPDDMVQKIRNITSNYNPRAVRRKEIPKPYDPSKTRPLGIPCIWDRLIQQCILQVLEPICEARFSENSFGFRPNRSCEHAVAVAYRLMQRSHLQYVVEVDIKGFFDNVDHSKLIKQIWALGIRDTKLIYLIKQILKAPIQLENGTIIRPTKGTPQGGIISPLLANIVLNELDQWVESQWKNSPIISNYSQRVNPNGSPRNGNAYVGMQKTRLKEMYIVRYADDFRIFCRTRESAERTMIATKEWLEQRLRLEVSPEKTRVIYLRKQYSEFLGIKMRLTPKKNKLVVKSRVCDKASKRIQKEAKQKARDIQRPKNRKTQCQAILDYNAYVIGVHNYYRVATHVSQDFDKIAFHASRAIRRIGKKRKRKDGYERYKAIVERYGTSAQIRWIDDFPIVPIGFVQTKPPLCKRRAVQKYTPEGRKEIHENLDINVGMLQALLRQPLYQRSAEYMDNRLSLFCAQYGKCAIIGRMFEFSSDIHCHHKLPKGKGGKDNYQNLILVHADAHVLVHATDELTVQKYLSVLSLSKPQLAKLNKLRKEAGNPSITA
jgi:group II intron reverse transcriptase/maturase